MKHLVSLLTVLFLVSCQSTEEELEFSIYSYKNLLTRIDETQLQTQSILKDVQDLPKSFELSQAYANQLATCKMLQTQCDSILEITILKGGDIEERQVRVLNQKIQTLKTNIQSLERKFRVLKECYNLETLPKPA